MNRSISDKFWIESLKEKSPKELGSLLPRMARTGNYERVEILLEMGADAHFNEEEALRASIEYGYPGIAQQLIDHGADINIKEGYLLRLAIRKDQTHAANFLIKSGIDIRANNDMALRIAAYKGCYSLVRVLLEKGADPRTSGGEALFWAAGEGNTKMMRLLIKHGATVNARDGSALRWASENGQRKAVKLLLDHGANPTVRDNAPLILAAGDGNLNIVKMLLKKGADYRARNRRAEREARINGHYEVLEYIGHWAQEQQKIEDKKNSIRVLKKRLSQTPDLEELKSKVNSAETTGLILAAGADRFNELVLPALQDKKGCLSVEDILYEDKKNRSVLKFMGTNKQLGQLFSIKIWQGRREDVVKLWAHVPEKHKEQVDFKALLSELNRYDLHNRGRFKNRKTPPSL